MTGCPSREIGSGGCGYSERQNNANNHSSDAAIVHMQELLHDRRASMQIRFAVFSFSKE